MKMRNSSGNMVSNSERNPTPCSPWRDLASTLISVQYQATMMMMMMMDGWMNGGDIRRLTTITIAWAQWRRCRTHNKLLRWWRMICLRKLLMSCVFFEVVVVPDANLRLTATSRVQRSFSLTRHNALTVVPRDSLIGWLCFHD
jgi:hypothetical protein